MRVGELVLDPVSHRVFANEQALDLGPTEFRLLQVFMSRPDRAYTRAQLLDLVWGTDVYVVDRTVDVHVRKIREKIGEDYIETIKGVGYRFKD